MIPTIPLNMCSWNRQRKELVIASEFCGMPAKVIVRSHHTGKEVLFVPLQPGDPGWDEDGWDGEQQVYKPVDRLQNVDRLIIRHEW
jgi:hypothetical protein